MRTWLIQRALIVLVGLLLQCIAIKVVGSAESQALSTEILKCAKDLLNNNLADLDKLSKAAEICYQQAFNEAKISDFLIRRTAYVNQPYFDTVLLWMVVVITMSGVILSALQLLGSYTLATSGKANFDKNSELTIETNKATLSSSIVGLFILLISLGFFMIYVYNVYTIKENPSNAIGGLLAPASGESPGGLGSPPSSGKN